MDISFYTLANTLGITCAAAAFLIVLRRTARGRQERVDTDAPPEQSGARPRQEAPHTANAAPDGTPERATDADRPPHPVPDTENGSPAGRQS